MCNQWTAATLEDIAAISSSGVDKHIVPGEQQVNLCNYLDVYRNRRITRTMQFATGSAKPSEIERFQLNKGDILITKDSETPDDIGIPAVVVDDLANTICGYHLALIRPNNGVDSRFLSYHLQSDNAKRHFLRTATGLTRFGLNSRAIASIPIALPQPNEQAAIARILDAVDTAIERTREAVEQVRLLRRSIMQEMLPPWIGFKHLRTDQLPPGVDCIENAKDVTEICNGSTPSREEGRYWRNGTIPWLPTGKVNDRIITSANEFVTESALRECSIAILPRGTVLVGMIGQGKTRGMTAYLDMESCINQNFGAYVPRHKIYGKWLFYYLDYHYARLREIGGGTNQGALNCFLLKRIKLPLPSLSRQQEVAALLDAVENLEHCYQVVFQQQQKLKKSLMYDLLTGTVRVGDSGLLPPP